MAKKKAAPKKAAPKKAVKKTIAKGKTRNLSTTPEAKAYRRYYKENKAKICKQKLEYYNANKAKIAKAAKVATKKKKKTVKKK